MPTQQFFSYTMARTS